MKPWNWLWIGVPALGLLEFAGHLHFRDAAPPPADYPAVGTQLRSLWQPGTLVVAAPYWLEPNVRAVVGDELIGLADAARADDSAYARALEVSLPRAASELRVGHGASWRARHEGAAEPRPWKLEREQRQGPLTIRLWANPAPEVVTFDFIENLDPERANVRRRRNKSETPCPWNARARVSNGALHGHPTFPRRRFDCGQDDRFVGVTVIEDENYRPHRCLWAKPTARRELVIGFDRVPMAGALKGFGGLPWFVERESHGAPIELRVLAGGREVGTFVHEDGEGWKPFAFDTQDVAGEVLRVEFVVTAHSDRDRQFCFQADIRETHE